jgi:hypothetical protein
MTDQHWEDVGRALCPVLRDAEGQTVLRFHVATRQLSERLEGSEEVTQVKSVEPDATGDGWVVRVEATVFAVDGRHQRTTTIRVPQEWVLEGPPTGGRELTAAEREMLGGWATTGRGKA